MSATNVNVVTFRRAAIPPGLSISAVSRIEHWGLFILYLDDESKESKLLYHADKTSIVNNSTIHNSKEWPIDLNDAKYHKVDTESVVGYLALGTHKLTKEMMKEYCEKVDKDRTFNTITNNCQAWVQSVLKELVDNKHLSQLAYDEFKKNTDILPLLGW